MTMTDAMTEILDRPNPQIRRRALKDLYLPLMFSPDPKAFNLRWVNEIATSPFLPVDVIGDNNEVMYTVPPLCRQPEQSTAENTEKLSMVLTHAAQESSRSMLHSLRALAEYESFLMEFVTIRSRSDIEGWVKVLEDCGFGDRIPAIATPEVDDTDDDSVEIEEGAPDDW